MIGCRSPNGHRSGGGGTGHSVGLARLRRLVCPTYGVRVEQVPFALYRSGFSRDFEDLVAFLATKTDKTTIRRLSPVDWDSVGGVCERVVADVLDPGRLDGLVSIGVDEVSWRRHHRYLTLVIDQAGKKIVWGAAGKDTATLDAFFDDLGSERAGRLEAVSMDMGGSLQQGGLSHPAATSSHQHRTRSRHDPVSAARGRRLYRF